MATPGGPPRRPSSPILRNARWYASDSVTEALADIIESPVLGLVLDVDALERSALAKFDRVMLLALQSLSRSGVQIVFAAERERARGERLHATIGRSWLATPREAVDRLRNALHGVRVIAIGDDAALFSSLSTADRGIVLGRPELVKPHIASAGDTTVRATLWWLVDERARIAAS
jgi:hypothetical protein